MTSLDTDIIVHPLTGQALQLSSASNSDLGHMLLEIRDQESQVRELKAVISDEVIRRMRFNASGTLRAEGVVLRGPAKDTVEEFDGAELRERLLRFVDEGVLSIEAVDAAVQVVVDYKVRASGVTALRKLGGDVAAAVDGCAVEAPAKRYIKVELS